MISLCPVDSYPTASMTIGVTEMMVMITIDERTSITIVEKTRQFINLLDLTSIVQHFLSCSNILLKSYAIIHIIRYVWEH